MKKSRWYKGYKTLRSRGYSHKSARFHMNASARRFAGRKRMIRSRTRASRRRTAYTTPINF